MFRSRTTGYMTILETSSFPKIPVYAFSKNIIESSKVKSTYCEQYPDYIDFGGKCLPIANICYLYYSCKEKNDYSLNLNQSLHQPLIKLIKEWINISL